MQKGVQIDESIARIIKIACSGANDTLALANTLIGTQNGTISDQQGLLRAANETIKALSEENRDLRQASLERDTVLKRFEMELQRLQLDDGRKREMIALAKTLGGGILANLAAHRLPASGEGQSDKVRELAAILVSRLSPETIERVRHDAGDDVVAALLHSITAT